MDCTLFNWYEYNASFLLLVTKLSVHILGIQLDGNCKENGILGIYNFCDRSFVTDCTYSFRSAYLDWKRGILFIFFYFPLYFTFKIFIHMFAIRICVPWIEIKTKRERRPEPADTKSNKNMEILASITECLFQPNTILRMLMSFESLLFSALNVIHESTAKHS